MLIVYDIHEMHACNRLGLVTDSGIAHHAAGDVYGSFCQHTGNARSDDFSGPASTYSVAGTFSTYVNDHFCQQVNYCYGIPPPPPPPRTAAQPRVVCTAAQQPSVRSCSTVATRIRQLTLVHTVLRITPLVRRAN